MRRFGSGAIERSEPNSALVKIKIKKNEIKEEQHVTNLMTNCIYAELRNEKIPGIPKKLPIAVKEKINKAGGVPIWCRQQNDYSDLKTKISAKILKKEKLKLKKNRKKQIKKEYISDSDYEAEIARRKLFIKEALKSIEHNELMIKAIENEILNRKMDREKDSN